MAQGPHIVTKRRPGKPVRFYVYAWRGGPLVHSQVGGSKPRVTGEIIDAIAKVRSDRKGGGNVSTIKGLITSYRSSPEWAKLAKSTRSNWGAWFDRIDTKFGKTPIAVFEDRRIRGKIIDWRNEFADRPRSADMGMQALSRLLSYGVSRGDLEKNHASGIEQLYDVNRSEIIWSEQDFTAFSHHASVEVQEAVDLAACTGLRRGDLVALPWSAIGEHAIIWQTSKSRGRARIVVPLLAETRAVLQRIKMRYEAEMASKVPAKRKPLPETVLSNSHWLPWTATGFGSRFNDAKNASGISVHLHDLRGTFATRCMIAGLTDQEIADIVGWNTKDVASIRIRYVDQARVVVALAERISAVQGASQKGAV